MVDRETTANSNPQPGVLKLLPQMHPRSKKFHRHPVLMKPTARPYSAEVDPLLRQVRLEARRASLPLPVNRVDVHTATFHLATVIEMAARRAACSLPLPVDRVDVHIATVIEILVTMS